MLSRENYTAEHIEALKLRTGADPSILERTIFAFGLLEAIKSAGILLRSKAEQRFCLCSTIQGD